MTRTAAWSSGQPDRTNREFDYSTGLIKLGSIDSGIEARHA
jgi:hypothetical protein